MDEDFRRRLDLLEAQVAELQATVQRLQGVRDRIPLPGVSPALPDSSHSFSELPVGSDGFQHWELWLNRLGIGLFVLGIGFFFLYAVERGWITPPVLVFLGLALGLGLVGLGGWLCERPLLGQYLQGGGLATFYITGFSAFQILKLVPFGVAFAVLVMVTALAFALALGRNAPALAYVGMTGGLATPFLLSQDGGSPLGLAGYTGILILASLGIHYRQGWRGFLWTSFALGWVILLGAASVGQSQAWGIQGIVFLTWLGYAGIPILRRERPALEGELLTLLNPLVALVSTWMLWQWPAGWAGGAFLALGALYLVVGAILSGWEWLFFVTGQVLVILGTVLMLGMEGDSLVLVPLAAEAWVLQALGIRYHKPRITWVAHGVWVILSSVSLIGAIVVAGRPPLVNSFAIGFAAVIAGAAGVATLMGSPMALIYGWGAYVGTLIWLQRELGSLLPALGALSWAGAGIGLVVLGLRQDRRAWRIGGMITIGVTILRLFVVDLGRVDPLWRVLLFVLVGGSLLGLSYGFRQWWRPHRDPQSPPS